MTSYASMAQRGREEARARTAGRRKPVAVRVEPEEVAQSRPNVRTLPGVTLPEPPVTMYVRLTGSCGHTLARALAGTPAARRLASKVGGRVTCPHEDCRIPAHVPSDADCEYVMGDEVGRRCQTPWRWDTPMGKVCTRHRNHYVREGYLAEEEAR